MKKLIVAGEPLSKKEQKELEKMIDQPDSNTLDGASTSLPTDSYENWE